MNQTTLNEISFETKSDLRLNANRLRIHEVLVSTRDIESVAAVLQHLNTEINRVLRDISAASQPRIVINYNGLNKFVAAAGSKQQIIASIQVDRSSRERISRYEHVMIGKLDIEREGEHDD